MEADQKKEIIKHDRPVLVVMLPFYCYCRRVSKRRKSILALVSHLRYNDYNALEALMATATSMVHIRVDDEIKAQATETLAAMGLSVSEAVRLFLVRVIADQALPFELKVPNARTRRAMAEADEIVRGRRELGFATADELFANLEKNSSK